MVCRHPSCCCKILLDFCMFVFLSGSAIPGNFEVATLNACAGSSAPVAAAHLEFWPHRRSALCYPPGTSICTRCVDDTA